MYSKLPHVVYGFHGCDESVKALLQSRGLNFKHTASCL